MDSIQQQKKYKEDKLKQKAEKSIAIGKEIITLYMFMKSYSPYTVR